MKTITFILLFTSVFLNLNAQKTDPWNVLFDGKDLTSFRGYKKDKPGNAWVVEDKVIKLKKEKGKTGGDLMTKGKYQFFELQLEWCLPKAGNSGIIYRVAETDGPAYKTGPEMQIFHQMKPGGKTDTGSCYALYPPKLANMKKIGEWNNVRLMIKPGNKVEHHMNQKLLCSYTIGDKDWVSRVNSSKFKNWELFGSVKNGHICFQDHGNEVWFRNVRIKSLK
ncbi:MAG: DUF1080 domain-containing protein [Opitutae bacterium]|nr:DUF1080 domain-containing protein [Opitutae bacterium]